MPVDVSELTIRESWQAIRTAVEKCGASLLERLAPGLSTDEINAFQSALGAELPSEYIESLQVCAGMRTRRSRTGKPYAEMLITDFIPLEPVVVLDRRAWLRAHYTTLAPGRVEGPIRHAFYDSGWIPVLALDDNESLFECIDTVPENGGTPGQIVSMCTDDPDRQVSAPSWRAVLQALARRFETSSIDPESLADDGLIQLDP